MKTAFLPILVVVLFCLPASAKTLNLINYATPDDGLDDSAGFQRAIDDLKAAGGGTLIVNSGDWNLNVDINLVTSGNNISYLIRGDKGSVIKLGLGHDGVAFYVGNANQIELRDLIFIGNPSADYDVGNIFTAAYTTKSIVSGCQFYGVHASNSLFYLGNTDAVFENDQFDGNASDIANIYALNFGGLTVRSSEFIDYGNFRDTYYSKTPINGGSWIRAESDSGILPPNATGQRVVRVQDVRFDEGAPVAVRLSNVSQALISGLAVNLSSTSGSAGVYLNNVEYAEIKTSRFGYTPYVKPAITAINNSTADIAGISVGGGVFTGNFDSTSQILFNPATCKGCAIRKLKAE